MTNEGVGQGTRLGKCLLRICCVAVAAAACATVRADSAPLEPDLYQEALRSLAEGRKSDANDELQRTIELAPHHAGAWLDLALIQCELGHAADAERLFAAIEARFSPPPGIKEIIAAKRAEGCKGRQPRSQTSILLGRGSDSNANQGASSPNFSIGSGASRIDLELSPDYLPQRDNFVFLSSEYRRELTPNGDVGFVQLRARQNDSLKRFDTDSLVVGAEQPLRLGAWALRNAASLGALTLGGQLYQRQAQLQTRLTPPLALPEHWQLSLAASLSHFAYPTQVGYDSNAAEASALAAYASVRWQAQASAGLLSDHRAAAHPGGNRHGWFAGVQGQALLIDRVKGELGWTRQTWVDQFPYSVGIIEQTRHQDTQLARAALILQLPPNQALQLEWRRIANDENISLFKYASQLLQLSWTWQSTR